MAILTYNELYELARDNVLLIGYDKNGVTLNIQATLLAEHIPSTDENSMIRSTSMSIGDWSLMTDSDGHPLDSDGSPNAVDFMDFRSYDAMENSDTTYPNWIKLYSLNYQFWINFDISKINSVLRIENP